MAVDVSRIPNNNKFDPVREAILQLQTEIEDTGATIGNGTLTISTSSPLTGSGTFTANQTGPTSISIGIDGAEYLTNITHDTVNQKLVVTYGDGTTADLSLAQYIDDTNLARLVSGSLDNQTGIATFTRDDATTFTVDLSALFDDTDTNDFLTSASFSTANGIITFGITNQDSVTVDIDGRYPLIGDLTAVSDNIITSADFSATDNRFKLTLTQADAGTIEASFDDVVLSESMAANYVPYVKVGGGDGDTTNAVLNDSFLKINGSTLELDWDTGNPLTVAEHDLKMRKDGGGSGTYYEATYAADSVSFLHYASSSDIDTAKIGATSTGRVRINDTYSLPAGDGTSGQVLSTNGSGDLSWVAAGGPTTSDLQDVTDNGATTTNYITSSANTSGQTYGNFTASGTEDWYMFALGARGASAGAYGIGLKNTITDRTLSIHVPNHAAYGSTGSVPKIGFYSNGSVELFTVKSDSGDSYVRGELEVGGRGIFNSDAGENNRVLTLKDLAEGTGNIVQYTKSDGTNLWEIVGRENGFYIYNNMISTIAIHINETTNNIGIGGVIDQGSRVSIEGTNNYLINLNNTSTDPRLQFQTSGTSRGHISAGAGLFTMYGEAGTALRFMPNGSSAMVINTDGSTSFIQGATSIPTGGISHYTNNYLYIKGGTAGLAIGDDSFSSSVYCVDNGNVEINTQGSIAMVIGTNKNVGVRVSSPEAGVDINTGTDSAQADWSSGTIPYGTEKADLVLTRRHSVAKDGNLGYAGALIDFRATNSANEWSTAQIVSTIDPNGGSNHSGGLHFLTSGGGTTDAAGRRNAGAAPAVRMSIDTQGRVGIGRYNPSYKLDIGGNLRIGAATYNTWFAADGVHTAIYTDLVLRIRDRVEVWGAGAGRQYLDVRDTDGSVKVKLDGESTSYFTRNVAIGATSATSALLISGTGVGAAIDFENTTATTGRNYRLVSLNAGGFALEDQTSATTPFTVSAGGDATFNAKLTAALDVKSQRLILRSDALERWEGTGDDKAISINYFGYNTTFDYFRDLNIYNGKGGFIATFDGSTSRLGLGITNPDSRLHVNGLHASNTNEITIGAGTDNAAKFTKSDNIQSSGNLYIQPYGSNNVVVSLQSGSKLGVGNSSPSYKLDVSGNARVTSAIATPNIYEATGGGGLALGNFTTNNADEWPKLYWLRDTANGWDEGLIKGGSNRGVFGRQHFGIHFDDDRSFGFHTSGWDTEMEIRGDGHIYQKGPVYIGRTAQGVAAAQFSVQGSGWYTSDSASRVLYLDGGASNGNIIQFQRYGVNKWEVVGREGTFYIYKNDGTGSGYRYQIDSSGNHKISGNLNVTGDVTAFFSDMRLKTKIGDIQDPIGKIQALNGFYYEPNEVAESYGYEKERKIGLSAQEVKEVVPEAVTDAAIGDGYMAVDYAKLVPVLVEAIKEQQKQIDELKARLDA